MAEARTTDHVPWSTVATFLSLPDALNLRLASLTVADRIQTGLGMDECSAWLEREVLARNVYLFNNKDEWMHARKSMCGDGGSDRDHDDGDTSEQCLMGWLLNRHPGKQREIGAFDVLLRCLRVIKHLPRHLTVAYSSRYGRHCWGMVPMEGRSILDCFRAVTYPKCHRGRENCSTCRTKIGTVPMPDDYGAWWRSRTRVESIDETLCIPVVEKRRKRKNAELTVNSGGLEGSLAPGVPARHNNNSQAGMNDRPPRKRLRLNVYHNKCIPNLPSDLVCPICRLSDRRTLMLTEISYVTEPGTERRVGVNGRQAGSEFLTFTPAVAHRSPGGEGEPLASRALFESFPPRYREAFFYKYFVESPVDRKHAISIHCEGCGRFGLLAPAALRELKVHGSPDPLPQSGPLENLICSSARLERPLMGNNNIPQCQARS
jgi:hypothetical protein